MNNRQTNKNKPKNKKQKQNQNQKQNQKQKQKQNQKKLWNNQPGEQQLHKITITEKYHPVASYTYRAGTRGSTQVWWQATANSNAWWLDFGFFSCLQASY